MRSIVVLPVLAAVVLAAGCAKKPPEAPAASEKASSSATAAAKNLPEPPQAELATVSGKVLETIDASDYTYMRLSTKAGEMWAAVTKADVKKGDEVTVVNAMTMDGFESRTLKRTFDRIVFGNLAPPGGTRTADRTAQQPPGVAPAPMASGHQSSDSGPTRQEMAAQHGQAAGGPEGVPDVKVEKAAGPNAKTVAELWKERATLKGKVVAVKAKVVKVTPGVMGKNWLHVRDGSGSKAARDNDLAVTTDATAQVGDVVTLTGLVSVDKDFGAGYAYPVIVEDAKLAK